MNKLSDPTGQQTKPRTGELLIQEGFITQSDLDKALLIQKKEKEEADIPFDVLLGKKGFLNASQIEVINGHPDLKKKLSQMVVEHEILEADKIQEILQKKQDDKTFGQSLITKGLITRDILDELIEKQNDALDIGELAVKLQMLKEVDLVRALSYMNCQRTIGEILCHNGVINPEDLSLALRKHNKRNKIGEILIRQGIINKTDFNTAAAEQKYSKEKMGTFLINKGLVTFHQLYNALSHQYNIPYMELKTNNYYWE